MLKAVTLLPERIPGVKSYPFSVPAIASLTAINFHSRITFFSGENGSGKYTLLEAVAAHIGFGKEGGNRNFRFETTDSVNATEQLTRALRLGFVPSRSAKGFDFRAESLYNVATTLDRLDEEQKFDPGVPLLDSCGGISLHTRSHGETT